MCRVGGKGADYLKLSLSPPAHACLTGYFSSLFFFSISISVFFFYIFKLSVVEMQKAAKAKQNDPSSVQNQKTVNVSPA